MFFASLSLLMLYFTFLTQSIHLACSCSLFLILSLSVILLSTLPPSVRFSCASYRDGLGISSSHFFYVCFFACQAQSHVLQCCNKYTPSSNTCHKYQDFLYIYLSERVCVCVTYIDMSRCINVHREFEYYIYTQHIPM